MGTRIRRNSSAMEHKDHPHAYGDKFLFANLATFIMGSSPRVWGQDYTVNPDLSNIGIIPTRMGTRFFTVASNYFLQDHPHAYGDKSIKVLKGCNTIGSSPRVWGQEEGTVVSAVDGRIIPTRMGTSCEFKTRRKVMRDHPHAYGDKASPNSGLVFGKGSSPRVWGQAEPSHMMSWYTWIIPTRMGTSKHTEHTAK